jgi:repressor LexA
MRQNRDDEHLAKLRTHYRRAGGLPSYAAVAALLGFASKTASVKLVRRLEARGYLRRLDGGRIAPGTLFFEVGLPDAFIRAGHPDDIGSADWSDGWSADEWLINDPGNSFAVRVRGDSMRDAGILDGDIVLLRRNMSPKPGDVVAAVVDGQLTLKEYQRRGGHTVLMAHHPDIAPIHPQHSIEFVGVACGLARRLRALDVGINRAASVGGQGEARK